MLSEGDRADCSVSHIVDDQRRFSACSRRSREQCVTQRITAFPFSRMETPRRRPVSNPASPSERPPPAVGGGGAETVPLPRAAGRSGEAQTRGGNPGPADGWLQGRGPGPARERAVPALRSARKPRRGRSFTPSIPKFNRDNRDQAPGCRSPRDPASWLACRSRFPRSGRLSAGGAVGVGGSRTLTDGRSSGRRPHAAETRGWGAGKRGRRGRPQAQPGPLVAARSPAT